MLSIGRDLRLSDTDWNMRRNEVFTHDLRPTKTGRTITDTITVRGRQLRACQLLFRMEFET